ncbi:MAG: LysR family transcriptional regulator, partial [Kangiellaceae bacterium]|nr:LysR family transcriptional regulator [Kangiellaceae bacterium]
MRIRHIEVFHAVYTTGSVTNAAKKLYVSQPSVSKVLGHAEQQLGFKLFDRIKGRLTPTKEADLLFDEVDQIYRQLININSAAENIKNNEVGKVSIAVTPALGFDLIPSTFIRFSRGREKISIDVQTVHNDRL